MDSVIRIKEKTWIVLIAPQPSESRIFLNVPAPKSVPDTENAAHA